MPSLYTRVFTKILSSSIAEDWQVRHVFEDMFKMADRFGVVDMTREAFSRHINVPLDIVNRAIAALESPDSRSRDDDEEGRRIVRLDDHRDWGWKIVNWEKYDSIKTAADQADRQRRHRQRLPQAPLQIPETQINTKTKTQPNLNPIPNPNPTGSDDVTCSNGDVTRHNGEALCHFDIFWEAYPRKVGKLNAVNAWNKAVSAGVMPSIDALVDAVRAQCASQQWQKEGGQFIPHPATWLNNQRWTDVPDTAVDKFAEGF